MFRACKAEIRCWQGDRYRLSQCARPVGLINVLSMGILSRAELAGLADPSMAYVLEHAVGPWGAVVINIGLVVSLLGAMLSWMVLCAEILFSAASDGSAPAYFRKENAGASLSLPSQFECVDPTVLDYHAVQ